MSAFLEILLSAFAAVTLENVIFTSAIGTSTLIECAKSPKQLASFGFFITEFSVLSSALAYYAEKLLTTPVSRLFLAGIYVLCLGFVYIVTLLVTWFLGRKYFRYLRRYVHLSAFNCAVLGCLFNNGIAGGNLGERVIYGAEIGIGFILAAYILAINYPKLSSDKVPASFRGFPASVLYIGIISMLIYSLNLR